LRSAWTAAPTSRSWSAPPNRTAAAQFPKPAIAQNVVGFGSDASQFSAIVPCVILGPSSIEQAHKPDEFIDISELQRAVPILRNLVVEYAKRVG
jgi:acetylornithine deacetylase/succinyl-diaminopimelate desuccinylase-like protein